MNNENPEPRKFEYWRNPEEKEKFKKQEVSSGKSFGVDEEKIKTIGIIPGPLDKLPHGLIEAEKTKEQINYEIIVLEKEEKELEKRIKKNPSLELEKKLDELKERLIHLHGSLEPYFNPNEN